MPTSSHTLTAVRARDLLVLRFELFNLVPDSDGLRRDDPAAPAYVVAHFPSQHLLEEAFAEFANDDGGALLRARLEAAAGQPVALAEALGAAPSRVAFTVPDDAKRVPAKLKELLEFLATCRLNVVATAEPPPAPGLLRAIRFPSLLIGGGEVRPEGEGRRHPSLIEPGPEQTSIELPYRLILSPPSSAGFVHATAPLELPGLERTELWHSRLGVVPGEEGTPRDHAKRTVRAVWVRIAGRGPHWNPANAFAVPPKPKGPPSPPEPPFLASLSEHDRHSIAHLSSNHWQGIETAPIEVERLALSALGGWLDATGRWQPPKGFDLEEWTNRTALGRDHFVKIVTGGHLFPFGHRASLIEITERKWQEGVPGRPAALRMRKFVVVRVPELRYGPGASGREARVMPFKRVRLRTLITPVIDWPASEDIFRVSVQNQPFRFAIEAEDKADVEDEAGGEDKAGNVTQFTMPLVFVALGKAADATGAAIATAALTAPVTGFGDRIDRADLGGSPLALVAERRGERGATTFPVARAAFGADPSSATEAGFHPKLADADVALPAVEIVTGKGATKRLEYHPAYSEHGFDEVRNQGEVFARLLETHALDLGKVGDRSGGLLAPSMAISGLSRAAGPLGGAGLDRLADGKFEPEAFFGGLASAKLFGIFPLAKVIKTMTGKLDAPGAAPKLITRQLEGAPLAAEWTFSPELKEFPAGTPVFEPRDAGSLTLTARIDAKGPQPKADVNCVLEHVKLQLPPGTAQCVVLPIEHIRFHAAAGAKPDIDVVLGKLAFVGPLSFINELQELIPLDGFSDPPALEVTPEGIASGFSIALPNVEIGMFALQHVSLGARLELPFIGRPPTFAFNFCTRNEPFLLTVSAFGGGGFFLIKVDPEGMQRLEAAFEFGASVSMDFVVASGGVHVMAGIYFAFDTEKGSLLTGYFRVGGNVSVLGIVSVSIELYLSLTYESKTEKAVGRATLTVEIELCLFSTSVEVKCERKLAGSAGDPPFEELLSPFTDPDDPGRTIDPWADHCRAYA